MKKFPQFAGRSPRRGFLADVGMGFTGLALGSLLQQDRVGQASETGKYELPDGRPHFKPRAKSVIWLFMVGGTSHVESFDPKPVLTEYANKEIGETPYKDCLVSPALKDNLRVVVPNDANGHVRSKLYPLQVGYRKHGDSGLEISDWWPHVAAHADDLAIVRSMWTTDNNHGAQLQFHTGRHNLDGVFPTVGSWVHYGLGTLNENLPQFMVMGTPIADCCGGHAAHGSHYLGPEHSGVQLNVDPNNPLPFAARPKDLAAKEQAAEFDLLRRLNGLAEIEYPDDPAMLARIRSYELAFRMQTSVPDLMQFEAETQATQEAYGLNDPATKEFGRQCLAARRMVERGVRFIQIFHGSNGGAGAWDAHGNLKNGHSKLCQQVDQPIGALLGDLKQRGLLEDTIVVWGTEFGRTPGAQGSDGRDHHPFGFSVWLAGGGIKGGLAHGQTDPIGFHAIEDRHYVTDLHATVLHQLGLDSHRLEVPGRKRLEIDHGKPIEAIIA